MKKYRCCLILGISYGAVNIFSYTVLQSDTVGTFLSSIPMWLVLPYFVAVKSEKMKIASINSAVVLAGIFTGYHIVSMLKTGVVTIGVYDVFWIATGIVVGCLWGAFVYPVNNRFIQLVQKNILPAVFIAEALNEINSRFVFRFPQNFNSYHMLLLITGVALFLIVNRKELKNKDNYIVFVLLSFMGWMFIETAYKILYVIL
ncbi:MAG: hypothetical protein IKY30_01320 [Oscillospiraceae bacterium]|nr:hypothetical protein [Oscillospiraceae bacterium]